MKLRFVILIGIVAIAAGLGGGFYWGERVGEGEGYRIGLLRGKAEAARDTPVQVIDRKHGLDQLWTTPAWGALGELRKGEGAALVPLLNQAPTPCRRQARRGTSLATAIVDPERSCPTASEQARLGLAAWRTFGDPDEVLAVLRAERRARADVTGRPIRGNPDADIVLVEWGDFQCPYCVRSQRLTSAILADRDDIRLVFKHLPLSFHPAAMPAALASEAAAEQGKFWEMHDALFDLGKSIKDYVDRDEAVPETGPVPFEELAGSLGMDVERFRADYRSEAVLARVKGDRAEARRIGVTGTPTFMVEDRKVVERLSVKVMGRLIDKARAERDWVFAWDLPPPPRGAGKEPAPDSEAASP